MKIGTWVDLLIVLRRNMLHLLREALVGNYQGLKGDPWGDTALPEWRNPSLPSCQLLSLTQWGSLMMAGVSVSMASERHKQPARLGKELGPDSPLIRPSATNKHLGQQAAAACETYGPGWALMKQLKSWWAGNSLIAACQSSSKYPTLTLYSIVWLRTQQARLKGNIWASFYFPPGKSSTLYFSWFGFLGIISFWCHFPVEGIKSDL